jgi:hypothetical protein
VRAFVPELRARATVDDAVVFTESSILHILLEASAEGLEIRFQKPDGPADHAEMRDLRSLDPRRYGLRADTKKARRLTNGERVLGVIGSARFDTARRSGRLVVICNS